MIADLEHSDTLTVADAGLPTPDTTQRIDLALKPGTPGFLETLLAVVLQEMFVEKAYVSATLRVSPHIYQGIQALLGDVPVETLPHVEFKQMSAQSKAIIRTGEYTPLHWSFSWRRLGIPPNAAQIAGFASVCAQIRRFALHFPIRRIIYETLHHGSDFRQPGLLPGSTHHRSTR